MESYTNWTDMDADWTAYQASHKDPFLKCEWEAFCAGRESANQELTRLCANLACIVGIIESVDERCVAADGPVTKTLDEMTQEEISKIYELAKEGGE